MNQPEEKKLKNNQKQMPISNPNYKLGVKTLTNEQLEAGLPAYKTLEGKINKIREEAAKVNLNRLKEETFEALKYDQIFSLLGGRGAGKTSHMLTLYYEYKRKEENIVLPMIMPELIDSDEDIVSWLLSAMEKNLDDVEDKIRSSGYDKDSEESMEINSRYQMFERCVFNKRNRLRSQFESLKNSYYTKIQSHYQTSNYSESQERKAQSVSKSFALIGKFVDYWNALVDVYQGYLKRPGSKAESDTPLIFIFIDDADLKPQILNELLFVIPKYLSHPNVVVFVCASHKTLKYAVKNHMYKETTLREFNLVDLMKVEYKYNGKNHIITNSDFDEGQNVKFHELRYGREYDKINKLSDEILRKLFPVYNRLYLKKYDRYEDKRLLPMLKDESIDCTEIVSLSEAFSKILRDFYEEIMFKHKKYNGLIEPEYNKEKKESIEDDSNLEQEFIKILMEKKAKSFKLDMDKYANYFYLSFLGRYPRDMVSVYYALKEMLSTLQNRVYNLYESNYKFDSNNFELPLWFIEDVYEIVIQFMDSAIASNRNLLMFSRRERELIKAQLLHWQLYVDYAKVLEIFREENYIEENIKNPAPFVEMLCLLNFIEQIIVMAIPHRKETHGTDVFRQLMDLCEIQIIYQNNDLDNMFLQYYTFTSLSIIPDFDIDRLEHQANFISGVNNLLLINENNRQEIARNNRNWYEIFVNTLFLRYSLYSQAVKYSKELHILKDEVFMGKEYRSLLDEYYSYIKKTYFVGEKPTAYKKIGEIKTLLYETLGQDEKKILDSIFKQKNLTNEARIQLRNIITRVMEDYIEQIKSVSDNLTVSIRLNKPTLNSLKYEADLLDDKKMKNKISSLFDIISDEKSLRRIELIEYMNYLNDLIDNTDYEYLEWRVWYSRLERNINDNVRIELTKVYHSFSEIIQNVKKLYKFYIVNYIEDDKEEEQINTDKLPFYSEFKQMQSEPMGIYSVIMEREWRKFRRLE